MALNTIEEIIDDLRQGKMVIIMDDEDRENEGDLLMAAEQVTPEAINFMARYGRGLICLTLTRERCQQLRLPLMVGINESPHSTNFTVSIEAASGVTTGISAADRATTVQAAVRPDALPQDLVQPGHIFPLMAQPGGVLVRAGHTEAGCDLARLAGLAPASVIVEILNEDGTMARRPDLEVFAQRHGLKIGTIADLIHYRVANEKTIERVSECNLPTEFGDFRLIAFQDCIDNELHMALVKGGSPRRSPPWCGCTCRTPCATCSPPSMPAVAGRCATPCGRWPGGVRGHRGAAQPRHHPRDRAADARLPVPRAGGRGAGPGGGQAPAHLRGGGADPERSRGAPHARAECPQEPARPLRVRPGGGGVCGLRVAAGAPRQ
jgi:3,4-dihydroxy-2-butanone 4-phosphate synthase